MNSKSKIFLLLAVSLAILELTIIISLQGWQPNDKLSLSETLIVAAWACLGPAGLFMMSSYFYKKSTAKIVAGISLIVLQVGVIILNGAR